MAKREVVLSPGQKYRDRLLAAALRLCEAPRETRRFLAECDAVIEAVEEAADRRAREGEDATHE